MSNQSKLSSVENTESKVQSIHPTFTGIVKFMTYMDRTKQQQYVKQPKYR
jgi:hypothetical protein